MDKNTNKKFKAAFSLIELSIVVLIIGIIIAGITQSSRLVRQFKLSSARSQTKSSPIPSIKDLAAWYDATATEGFIESEMEDSAVSSDGNISTWYDLNPSGSIKYNATNDNADTTLPKYYANCINGLPCIRFDGSNDLLDFDGSFLVGTNYTIFVVEQRRAETAKYFIGKSTTTSANAALEFGYSGTSTLRISHGDSSNLYTAGTSPAIAAYSLPQARVHAFVNGIGVGYVDTTRHYLNGTKSTLTNVGTPNLTNLTAYTQSSIGSSNNGGTQNYYNGDIGEIIFYNRALKEDERSSVEAYLLKKWGIH